MEPGIYTIRVTGFDPVANSNTCSTIFEVVESPTILYPPQDRTAYAGTEVALRVVASGSEALRYQWRRDGEELAGETNSLLVIANVQPDKAGSYSVVVTNRAGSATSGSGYLSVVVIPPSIVQQPAGQTVIAGSSASFTAVCGGSPPLSYQWFFNGTNVLTGATNATLTVTNAQPSDAGLYSLVVTNLAGAVTSAVARLTVIVTPAIVENPTTQTVVAGGNASFNVLASGSGPLSYQWFFNWTNVLAGATAETLSLTNVQPADAGGYSVLVTNLAGTVTSAVARLRVLVVPRLVARAANGSIELGLDCGDGGSYLIQASTNLVDWRSIAQIAATSGSMSFTDTNAPSFDRRFYRALGFSSTNTVPHPADLDANFAISAEEINVYNIYYQFGYAWPIPPSPILGSYTTNANLIFTSGPSYHLDPSKAPPDCWVPSP